MNRIAVDVVLLPDEAMTAQAIKANEALDQDCASRIVLGRETCLPHASLAMGCIECSDIEPIESLLRTIADELPIGKLAVTGVVTSLNARHESVSAFAVAMTPMLRTLHERVMGAMGAHFTYDVTDEMLCGTEETAQSSLQWIRTFPKKAAFGAFFPHITIGYGTVKEAMLFPMEMVVSRLALCHLGNHCTCRQVLAAVAI